MAVHVPAFVLTISSSDQRLNWAAIQAHYLDTCSRDWDWHLFMWPKFELSSCTHSHHLSLAPVHLTNPLPGHLFKRLSFASCHVENIGTDQALNVDNNWTEQALNVDHNSTEQALYVANNWTEQALYVANNWTDKLSMRPKIELSKLPMWPTTELSQLSMWPKSDLSKRSLVTNIWRCLDE
jgi:hypothetical protein